jgi:hypothetical protein
MGYNSPSVEEIRSCKYFCRPADTKVDVSILLGESPKSSQHYSLLLMRFWKTKPFSPNFSETKLWTDIRKVLPRNGTSATRLGGSSGTLKQSSSKTFREFISQPGTFPRKVVGVKFLRNQLFYRCLYISPYTGDATNRTKYSEAHKGGVFRVTHQMLLRSPFLFEFTEKKIIAAIICINLLALTGVIIQPLAVDHELQTLTNVLKEDLSKSKYLTYRKKILQLFISRSRHTVVTHAVGFHRDVFDKGKPILENKKCFVVPSLGTGCGRGGAGKNKFVVALLDW